MKNLRYIAILTGALALMSFTSLFGQQNQSYISGDSVRIPYQAHRIYHLRCVAGAPLIVELPVGETVKNVWIDRMWFNGEAVPGSNRLMLKAQNAEGVENQKTTVHIETGSDLRISAVIECLPYKSQMPPSVYTFYLDDRDEQVAIQRQIQAKADEQAQQYKTALDERYRNAFADWKSESMRKIDNSYRVNGKVAIQKVIDDGVQTWIYAPELSELQSLRAINKDRQVEALNFEYANGAYVVNRVLADGERFELRLGKKKTVIRR